jgi:alpha-D-xyloside xylohydrolase
LVKKYLPEGRWTNFITGDVVEGGRWVREKHGYMSIPIMARPGSVIPVGSNSDRPDYDYAENVTFHLFELQENVEVSRVVPKTNGETSLIFRAEREGEKIHITVDGEQKTWFALLRGLRSIKMLEGGESEENPQGVLLKPHRGVKRLRVHL